MAKQTYALEPNGPKRLEVSWGAFWKDITIRLDGSIIGTIPGHKELQAGQEFQLPDGSVVSVKKFSATELQVLRNGKPLPGSASGPGSALQVAYMVVFFIAGLNIVLGLSELFFPIEPPARTGFGVFTIVVGLVFLVLGFFVSRKSIAALVIATVIYALDSIAGIGLAFLQGNSPGIGGILMRVMLLIAMAQGIGAIRALRQTTNP
jgi:hypothetical protein